MTGCRDVHEEPLEEIARRALSAMDVFFRTLDDASSHDGQVDPDVFSLVGSALVARAKREILGSIKLLENHLGGVVSISRGPWTSKSAFADGELLGANVIPR